MTKAGYLRGLHSVAFLLITGLFFGCGGGGSDESAPPTPPPSQFTASGTAAGGAALAGATVTLKDGAGNSRTATTAADGTYAIDTTGLTPPFLLLVTTAGGTKYYSVSANANDKTTINITPLTDLIIRSWYDVQGVSVDTAFAAPGTNPPPTPTEVAVIGTVVQNMVQLWLNEAGVTQADFNLISTPFTANGAGIDLVLDQTTVNASTGQVTISAGGVTQNSTLTASNGTINIVTTTTGTTGTSTSSNTTVVPVQTAQQAALEGITTTFNNFAAVVNAKGAALAASDLLPFMDPDLLSDGMDQAQLAAQLAERLAGQTVSFTLLSINSLDTANNVADVVFQLSRSQGGQTENRAIEFFFKKVNNAWLLSGNHRVAEVELRAMMQTSQGANATQGYNSPVIEAAVHAPEGAITGVTVSGGGVWADTPLLQGPIVSDPTGTRIGFDKTTPLATNQLIPAGTSFTVAVATAGSGTVTYTKVSNAFTTEPISVTNLTGITIADAHLGSPLTVNWTLPKTFAISQVSIEAVSYDGPADASTTTSCKVQGPILGIASTTAQVTFPAICGSGVRLAIVNVQVLGINGEHELVYYQFGQ